MKCLRTQNIVSILFDLLQKSIINLASCSLDINSIVFLYRLNLKYENQRYPRTTISIYTKKTKHIQFDRGKIDIAKAV